MANGAALSFTRLVVGVARVKIIAVMLGPDGLGLLSIILQIYTAGVALVSMSLAIPIINLGRPGIVQGKMDMPGQFAGTAIALVLLNSLLMLMIWWLLGTQLEDLLEKNGFAGVAIWPIAVAIILAALSSSFWEGLVFLADRFDLYVIVGIIAAIIDAAIISLAVYRFGLAGVIYAIPLGAAAMLGVYILITMRDATVRSVIANATVKLSAVPQLLGYSIAMLVTIGLSTVGLAYLRLRVLTNVGAEANGELQVATAFSGYLLPFIMTGFWGHLHARAAGEGDTKEVRKELNHALSLGLLMAFSGCGLVVIIAPFIIPIFYTGKFIGAEPLITAYMIGELPFQVSSLLIAFFLTVGLRRIFIFTSVLYIFLMVVSGTVFIGWIGVEGYVFAHIVSSFILLATSLSIAMQRQQISLGFVLQTGGAVFVLVVIGLMLYKARKESIYEIPASIAAMFPVGMAGMLVLKTLWERRTCPPPA